MLNVTTKFNVKPFKRFPWETKTIQQANDTEEEPYSRKWEKFIAFLWPEDLGSSFAAPNFAGEGTRDLGGEGLETLPMSRGGSD